MASESWDVLFTGFKTLEGWRGWVSAQKDCERCRALELDGVPLRSYSTWRCGHTERTLVLMATTGCSTGSEEGRALLRRRLSIQASHLGNMSRRLGVKLAWEQGPPSLQGLRIM